MYQLSEQERRSVVFHYREMLRATDTILSPEDIRATRRWMENAFATVVESGKAFPAQRVIKHLRMTKILVMEFGLGRASILANILYDSFLEGVETMESIEERFGKSVSTIVHGLSRAHELYRRHNAVETENFRQLLLTFAEDVRVILIMIAERLDTIRDFDRKRCQEEDCLKVAQETSSLYAPLAHRMGLYAIKTELEDLSLKYTLPDVYHDIANKLNETKRSRDQYIASFIAPLKNRLEEAGLHFDIKGRTKSIHSIWNKIQKQHTPFENIYDLFAIRIILDSPEEKEKFECWQAYSIVTDMYKPNPKRLRDWLSIPKSNGYESLHITVMGNEGKWVEVQIRTQRMDEIAEKGVAAHWKYKGIKSDSEKMDEWLKEIRSILEDKEMDAVEVKDIFRLNLYDDDVFVFTPTGDLFKLKKGSTVLDFAFAIHSGLGCRCVGAKVGGRNVPIKYVLSNGDQVEILTSPNQTPKRDWLKIAVTSKARTKIKQALKEDENKAADLGREALQRRMKNRKIDFDESQLMRLVRKHGFKFISEFYQAISHNKLDVSALCDELLEMDKHEESPEIAALRRIDNFTKQTDLEKITAERDVLTIGNGVKNVQYTFAKCCMPVFGDPVFGFVSVSGGIKIHRDVCPNAQGMKERFPYRVVEVKWAGTSGKSDLATLQIIGNDDVGIVSNVTSIISKEPDVQMRSISVNSHDGLFEGTISVTVNTIAQLSALTKKLQGVKGVKRVERM